MRNEGYFEGVNYIGSQGSGTVGEILDLAKSHDVELRLARLKPPVAEVLERDGLIDRIGKSKIFTTVYAAAEDHIDDASDGPSTPTDA